jgi:hypothetical protein
MSNANSAIFQPNFESSPQERLADFVTYCRHELLTFGRSLDWSDVYWPSSGVTFRTLNNKSRVPNESDGFEQPFLDFSKSYHRYVQTNRPNTHMAEMRAIKCLYSALIEHTYAADPCLSTQDTFDLAAQVARSHYKSPYAVGRELAYLASFISEMGFVEQLIDWKHPFKRPRENNRTGPEARQARSEKLPDERALDIIARVFASNPTDPTDIFVTSLCALMMCIPSRISEWMELPADCEHYDQKSDGTAVYGIKIRAKKGGPAEVRWVISSMVEIAQTAIARLKALTEPARELARWLELNPGKIPDWIWPRELFGKDALSRPDVEELLQNTGNLEGLAFAKVIDGIPCVELSELEKWIWGKQPKHFPWTDSSKCLRFSNALFCMFGNMLHAQRGLLRYRIWAPDNNTLNDRLGLSSIFKENFFYKHKIPSDSDDRLKITTKSFRHYLNTLAFEGNLGQDDIARWSGRADISQNSSYFHPDPDRILERIRRAKIHHRNAIEDDLSDKALTIREPITVEEARALKPVAAHITELGFCEHDFALEPCPNFRDCINCADHLCVKGDSRTPLVREALEERLDFAKELSAEADQAAAEGFYGGDPWSLIQKLTVERLSQLTEIMESAEVPDGSIVRLGHAEMFTSIQRALAKRGMNLVEVQRRYQVNGRLSLGGPSQ